MKKLGKLQINSSKLMQKDELVTLRGGYDESGTCGFQCSQCDGGWEAGGCQQSLSTVEAYLVQCNAHSCQDIHWCCDHCYETTYCG